MGKRGRKQGSKLPYDKQKFYVIYDKDDNIRQCGTAQQLVDEGKYSSLNSFHSAIKHIKDYNRGTVYVLK